MIASIRLSQLSLLIQETLRDRFALRRFNVIAEVANHSYYSQKGFHYFDLVEKEGTKSIIAKLPAVAWSAGAQKIQYFEQVTGQRFGNGIRILAEVAVDYHPVYGLKLTLLDIDVNYTLGALELARKATIERLVSTASEYVWRKGDALGSFNKELSIPPVIQHIAVISSQHAAGYEDFIHSLENNIYGYRFEISVFFTPVQGETNAAAFVQKLVQVEKHSGQTGLDYDAVVIIRGGGAGTDLLLFDVYELALGVAACPFPVLTGIGHQKNETITDMVANTSLKTPTRVAEFILQHNRTFEEHIVAMQHSIITKSQQLIAVGNRQLQERGSAIFRQSMILTFHHKRSLEQFQQVIFTNPRLLLAERKVQVDHLQQRLHMNVKNLLRHQSSELSGMDRMFRLASPVKLLQRGFSLIKWKGKLITNAAEVATGDEISVIMSDSILTGTVQTKKEYDGNPFDI